MCLYRWALEGSYDCQSSDDFDSGYGCVPPACGLSLGWEYRTISVTDPDAGGDSYGISDWLCDDGFVLWSR